MSVTIPSLDPVTDILDTDKIMVTQSSGQTYTIDGASFNKRNQAVIANSTTLTGAPLKTGNIVRVYFTADITGVNTTDGLVLSYNGTNKNVKVPKDGSLVKFTAQNMGGSPTVYKYLQAYTTLELLYDGTNFVIIGNPVVISSADYTIYADGKTVYKTVNTIQNGNMNNVTSNAVAQLTYIKDLGASSSYTSFVQIPKGVYSLPTSYYSSFTDKPSGANGRAIFIAGASGVTSDEQIALLLCASSGKMWIGNCYGGTARYIWQSIN